MNELVIWQGGNEKYEVSVDYLSVNSDLYSFNNKLSVNSLIDSKEKGIDVFDVKFSNKVKTADKKDYLFAIFSGLVSAAIDHFAIGRTDLTKIKEQDKGFAMQNCNAKPSEQLSSAEFYCIFRQFRLHCRLRFSALQIQTRITKEFVAGCYKSMRKQ